MRAKQTIVARPLRQAVVHSRLSIMSIPPASSRKKRSYNSTDSRTINLQLGGGDPNHAIRIEQEIPCERRCCSTAAIGCERG